MDEMTNEAVVEEQVAETPAEEVAEEVISDEEFDAIWDDDSEATFVEEDEPQDADQPTEEQPEPQGETEPAEAEQKPEEQDADQYLELKHFDEVKKVTKEEAKTLAQKGLDYDRIRGKLAEAESTAQSTNAKVAKYEAFFNEVRGEMDIDALMADTLARVRADRNGTDYEAEKAKLTADQQKEQPQQQSQPQFDVLDAMRKESYSQFVQVYPNVKAADIPQEVWDDMQTTNNLVASYAKYEVKKLREENKVLQQNATNKARAVGSMKSSGKGSYEKSEFDRVFDDDDY